MDKAGNVMAWSPPMWTSDSLVPTMSMGNSSESDGSVSDMDAKMGSVEVTKQILAITQVTMTTVGVVANFFTMFILKRLRDCFAPGYLLLLRNQAFVDLIVCFGSTVMMLQPPMWRSGILILDTIVCQVWHGQFLYWVWVLTSIWNLIMVGYERYLAICFPFRHVDLTISRIRRLIAIAYAVGFTGNCLCVVQVRMEGDTCISEYYIRGATGERVFFVYGILVWVMYWLTPFLLFCGLYGRVLFTLLRRRDSSDLGESRVVNQATSQMTKTALAVTVIFVMSLSWDIWYYLLGRLGLVTYIKNTLLQLIGLWLSAFNSVANPFVYFVLLPAFRRATFQVMLPCFAHHFGTKKAAKNGTTAASA